MEKTQNLICLDLEGVLIPEIWIALSTATGLEKLQLTTRDVEDYDKLMKLRLDILRTHNITLTDIQKIIKETILPFNGAIQFLHTLRTHAEVIILSDTFTEFFSILKEKLNFPCILCNSFQTNTQGIIEHHVLCLKDRKTHAVKAFQNISCKVAAVGDSYNDVGMISHANWGAFFKAPESILQKYPTIPAYKEYNALISALWDFFEINVST